YDQGDCCWCDCSDSSCPSMGDESYDCRDPFSECFDDDDDAVDDDDAPTPAPVTTTLATPGPSPIATPEPTTTPAPSTRDLTSAPGTPVSSATSQLVVSPSETTSTTSSCIDEQVGDGYCDAENNNETCLYDGGDCCECTCDTDATYPCGTPEYDCLDSRGTTCDDVTTASSSTSLYNANAVFALGISCAMVLVSTVATS
ncbi:unnamed protein product, partial [Ectocarpus sp. 12 AP-2014]